jgi:hypothetical protein
MTIVETFVTETGLITIQFEFQYPDQPQAVLTQVIATFLDENEVESLPSPMPSPVMIALSGITTFSGQTPLNASGSCRLVTTSGGTGLVYFDALRYSSASDDYEFEGTAVTFSWISPSA